MIYFGLAVLVLGVVLLGLITLMSRKPKLDKAYYAKRWSKIEELMAGGGSSDIYRAVVDADKLLDHALKAAQYRGKNMGGRLKSANHLKSINVAWNAHKLRNKLVHEDSTKLDARLAQAAINSYKKIMQELGAL